MMPQWKDVTSRMTNLALSPTGTRAAVEARGEIFTIPAEKGDVRNLTQLERLGRGRAGVVAGRRVGRVLQRQVGRVQAVHRAAGRHRAAARDHAARSRAATTRRRGRRTRKKLAFQDTHFRLWVVDVASGRAKVADTDPYYQCRALDRAGVEPRLALDRVPQASAVAVPRDLRLRRRDGRTRQVTDGLADATSPAWDASGKYLWFLASTNFGLQLAVLDMSAYDRPDDARAVPDGARRRASRRRCCPRATRRRRRRAARRRDRLATRSARRAASRARRDGAQQRRAAASPLRIDFDGLQQRIVAVQASRRATTRSCGPGAPGTVFFVERTPARAAVGGGGGGSTLHRYQLSDARAAPFATGVAQYVVSADGKKLLYRTGGGGGGARRATAAPLAVPRGRRPRGAARPAPAASTSQLRATSIPKAEFKQIFDEGWRNQRNNLYVQNLHGTDWPAMKKMYEPLLPYVMHRADLNYLHGQHGRRDRDRSLVRARRRDAGGAGRHAAACSAPTSRSRTAATASRGSTTPRAGTPSCARRWRRRA